MRRVAGLLVMITLAFTMSVSVQALGTTTPPPILPKSPLLITAYSIEAGQPLYFEIYNDSNEIVKASDWTLNFMWSLESGVAPSPVTQPLSLPLTAQAQYIPPGEYVVVSFGASVDGASVVVNPIVGEAGNFISAMSLENEAYQPYDKIFDVPESGQMRLNQTTTGYTTTKKYAVDDRTLLYDNRFYQPLDSFPLKPTEILANPKACSPLETDLSCKEYVEFFNPTASPISFEGTRLRIGYQGQGGTTVQLSGMVDPGGYVVFNAREDGSALSITNSGGYVWLQDRYGVKTYDNSVTPYANASGASHKGESWSLVDGSWQWSVTTPGSQNRALPIKETKASQTVSSLRPCAANQYRNPATNRCKLISSQTSSLTPCAATQYRNPETNRCRSLSSSSTSLQPCAANQFRNPETNRCKSLVSTASSRLKPCTANQERNPDTNRCRNKTSAIPDAAFAVKSVKEGGKAFAGWWALGGVGVLAVGYGAWEWRREVVGLFRKTATFFRSGR